MQVTGGDDARALIRTVGHGTLPEADFAGLVTGAGVRHVIDIRSFPGSRHNPQFGSEAMARWLPERGLRYSWIRALGGRRRGVPDSPHVALRHPSFRAYADHMTSAAFATGLGELLADCEDAAVMCSESLWWRCHRRLLADHLVLLDGVRVEHLMHDGRRSAHVVTDGVRVDGDHLVYDLGATAPLT